MHSKKRQFIPVLMTILTMAAMVGVPAWAGADDCQVNDVNVLFNTVQVNVQNTSETPRMVRVVTEVRIGFFRSQSVKDVRVAPKSQATASSSFWGPVTDVVTVGIIEDTNPL